LSREAKWIVEQKMSAPAAADIAAITAKVVAIVRHVADGTAMEITSDTPLIASQAAVKSRQLVEILLEVEEYAEEELGVTFNWSGDSAMSQRHSIFRTPASLAEHLASLVAQGGAKGEP
jgi:hypothetical protein